MSEVGPAAPEGGQGSPPWGWPPPGGWPRPTGGYPPPPTGGYPPPPTGGYPPPGWYGQPPWYPPVKPPKGYGLGLPPAGPGSLAAPWQRLAGRLLDSICFLPIWLAIAGVAIGLAAPHYGRMFPPTTSCSAAPSAGSCPNVPTPGFVWLYLTLAGVALVATVLYVLLDAMITSHWGRTPGKAIIGITAVTVGNRRRLTFWRALARAAAVTFAGFLSWLGLIDFLWCLWDENQQCIHDKVVDTVVISDK